MTPEEQAIEILETITNFEDLANRTKSADYEEIADRMGIHQANDTYRDVYTMYVIDWQKFGMFIDFIHGIIGKMTELGEFADPFKKHLFYGKDLDRENMREELGDDKWYDAIMAPHLDTTLMQEMFTVIQKLRKRYPEAFSNADALARKDKQE